MMIKCSNRVLSSRLLGSVEVVFNTMKQHKCNIALHTILWALDVVLNMVVLWERGHCMDNNVDWLYSCGMGKD
jgi:hypothetical protein